jgi:hypothetical protein
MLLPASQPFVWGLFMPQKESIKSLEFSNSRELFFSQHHTFGVLIDILFYFLSKVRYFIPGPGHNSNNFNFVWGPFMPQEDFGNFWEILEILGIFWNFVWNFFYFVWIF